MSTVKPLALGILLWGIMGTAVQADPITWPSGLDNWLIYLAAGSDGGGNAGPPPISYSPVTTPLSFPPAVGSVSNSAVVAPISEPAPVAAPASPYLRFAQPGSSPTPTVFANAPLTFNQPPAASSTPVSPPSFSTAGPAASAVVSGPVNAFLNLGTGPYPQQSAITTGNALPWYDSAHISNLFGGQPTAQQIQSFDSTILQRVQQTFSQSGVAVSLTTDPNVAALHTISLVSNTASASLGTAIGMTQVGSNGFSFIDQSAPTAQSLDQLEWIVAHNISHELMLAFGVPENYDKSGNFIDAKVANWSMMVSPSSTFSPAAAAALSQALASQNNSDSAYQLGAQEYNPLPAAIPEPTTLALWALAAAVVVARRNPWRRNHGSAPL